jgi:chromosome segregation ATPase
MGEVNKTVAKLTPSSNHKKEKRIMLRRLIIVINVYLAGSKIFCDSATIRLRNQTYFCFITSKKSFMIRKLAYALPIVILIASCDTKEKDTLRSQVDSLKVELETSQKMAQTLTEVGTLMDSIDASRQLLRVNMVEGTTYEDYTSRMKDINGYVRDTQHKLDDLEKSLATSKASNSANAKLLKNLRAQLEGKTQEIAALQEQVEKYRSENQNLITTVSMQEAELADKQSMIETKTQELALIEARVQELMIQSKMTEADAYFARGQAVEEAANRTKLAPRKKKETFKEAIELYKKALSLGKNEAQDKITELEKKI